MIDKINRRRIREEKQRRTLVPVAVIEQQLLSHEFHNVPSSIFRFLHLLPQVELLAIQRHHGRRRNRSSLVDRSRREGASSRLRNRRDSRDDVVEARSVLLQPFRGTQRVFRGESSGSHLQRLGHVLYIVWQGHSQTLVFFVCLIEQFLVPLVGITPMDQVAVVVVVVVVSLEKERSRASASVNWDSPGMIPRSSSRFVNHSSPYDTNSSSPGSTSLVASNTTRPCAEYAPLPISSRVKLSVRWSVSVPSLQDWVFHDSRCRMFTRPR
mmetsp:Transcript_9505/g.20049  ORF Transcript_9505/g.20049 Transcript_9505/m.20049 type:complete len:268 (-) Transcript_9505:696-1499(-)